jgi:hypothetical protein
MGNDHDLLSNNEIPRYSVSLWEGALIVMGAIGLVGVALAGLGVKVLSNAFDPIRAEAIARSLIDYRIPSGSQGIFGINIGSAKLAWVRSQANPPDVILFVGRTPLDKDNDGDQQNLRQDFETPPSEDARQSFQVDSATTENRLLCGKTIPVQIAQGQQTFGDSSAPVPAIRYTATIPGNSTEKVVILTTNGKDAKQKAEIIFQSLKCR